MCTAITHAIVGAAATGVCYGRRAPLKVWLLAMACSAAPDLDVGLFHYGVEYGDFWGHRGMTHSLLFALLLAIVIVMWAFRTEARPLSRRWWGLIAFLFIVTASHGVLDAFTDGGLGVAFFSPFYNRRYFMPWHPIAVSAFGLTTLFTRDGWRTLSSELLWVWLPAVVVCAAALFVRLRMARRA